MLPSGRRLERCLVLLRSVGQSSQVLRPPTTLDACCCERFVAVFAIPMFIKRLRLRPLIRRAEQDFLQVFCKRFSGHERAQVSDRQGADARRDAIPG